MHSHTGNQLFVASRVRSLTRGGARISPTKLDQDHCHNRIMRHFKIEKNEGVFEIQKYISVSFNLAVRVKNSRDFGCRRLLVYLRCSRDKIRYYASNDPRDVKGNVTRLFQGR